MSSYKGGNETSVNTSFSTKILIFGIIYVILHFIAVCCTLRDNELHLFRHIKHDVRVVGVYTGMLLSFLPTATVLAVYPLAEQTVGLKQTKHSVC